jgi:hypothetical protein
MRMLEELAETVVGPWGIAAVLLFGTDKGRKVVRAAFKETVKFGIIASERMKETYAEIQEEASDAIAEAQAEQHQKAKKTPASKTHSAS